MQIEGPAPYHTAITDGPPARAVFVRTPDGKRLRFGHWAPEGAARGTVWLFSGRTEYLEKYGNVASKLTAAGWHVVAPDWRGQGLSERLTTDPHLCHIDDMASFQCDVDTLERWVAAESLPRPFMLLAHSMGGAIGLRALLREKPIERAAFCAPMWGINAPAPLGAIMRPLAAVLGRFVPETYVPGGSKGAYPTDNVFADNLLTNDRTIWDQLQRQLEEVPALSLGDPSNQWLNAALREMAALHRAKLPLIPTIVGLGTHERIVAPSAVRRMTDRWRSARLISYFRAEHELMMETPETREAFLGATIAHFNRSV